jgi:hypothetical protein
MKEKAWKGIQIGDNEYQSTLANVLYWYSLYRTDKQKKEWFLKYCKTKKIKIGNVPDGKIGTVGSVARLVELDFPFKKKSLDHFKGIIDQLKRDYPLRKSEKKIMREFKPNLTEALTMLDVRVDQILSDFVKDTVLPLNLPKLTSADKLELAGHYQPSLTEINIVLSESCPEDLKEAYANHTKWTLKRVKAFYETLMEFLSEKVERKTRKKKNIPAEKLVSSLKYKTGNDTFKSINPEYIIGSTGLLVLNDKYNTISYYEGKLSIKGTSVIGYDETLSCCKHIKDIDGIRRLILADSKSIKKRLAELPKDKPLTGRINDNCILLKNYS